MQPNCSSKRTATPPLNPSVRGMPIYNVMTLLLFLAGPTSARVPQPEFDVPAEAHAFAVIGSGLLEFRWSGSNNSFEFG